MALHALQKVGGTHDPHLMLFQDAMPEEIRPGLGLYTALNLKRKEPDSVIDGPMNSKKIDAKTSDSLFDGTGPIAPEGDRKKYFLGIVCVLAVAVEQTLFQVFKPDSGAI